MIQELKDNPSLAVGYHIAPPRMAREDPSQHRNLPDISEIFFAGRHACVFYRRDFYRYYALYENLPDECLSAHPEASSWISWIPMDLLQQQGSEQIYICAKSPWILWPSMWDRIRAQSVLRSWMKWNTADCCGNMNRLLISGGLDVDMPGNLRKME